MIDLGYVALTLEQATAVFRETLDRTPSGSPQYRGALRNLAYAVQLRFESTGSKVDQDQAISLLQELEAARRDQSA